MSLGWIKTYTASSGRSVPIEVTYSVTDYGNVDYADEGYVLSNVPNGNYAYLVDQALIDRIDAQLNPVVPEYRVAQLPPNYTGWEPVSGAYMWYGTTVSKDRFYQLDTLARFKEMGIEAYIVTDSSEIGTKYPYVKGDLKMYFGGNGVIGYVSPNDGRFIPEPRHSASGTGFFQQTLSPYGIGESTREMHGGGTIIAIAVTAGVASSLIAGGAAAGEGVGVGAGAAATTEVGAGATTAAFVGDIPVAGEAGVSIFAEGATAATGAASVADATVPLDALPVTTEAAPAVSSTVETGAFDAGQFTAADVGLDAQPAASSGNWWDTVKQSYTSAKDVYSAYKPYVDVAKSAYGGYQALTAQQKASNTPASLTTRPTGSGSSGGSRVAPFAGIVDSGVMPVALLLLAVIAKSAKSA